MLFKRVKWFFITRFLKLIRWFNVEVRGVMLDDESQRLFEYVGHIILEDYREPITYAEFMMEKQVKELMEQTQSARDEALHAIVLIYGRYAQLDKNGNF